MKKKNDRNSLYFTKQTKHLQKFFFCSLFTRFLKTCCTICVNYHLFIFRIMLKYCFTNSVVVCFCCCLRKLCQSLIHLRCSLFICYFVIIFYFFFALRYYPKKFATKKSPFHCLAREKTGSENCSTCSYQVLLFKIFESTFQCAVFWKKNRFHFGSNRGKMGRKLLNAKQRGDVWDA